MADPATTAAFISAGANVFLALVVIYEVRVAKEAVGSQLTAARTESKHDHDRRKKQATMDYYRVVMEDIQPSRDQITEMFGTGEIPKPTADRFHQAATQEGGEPQDNEIGSAIRTYLNGLEKLAVGTNLGVFDEDVLRRLAKYRFINALSQFRYYLAEACNTDQTKDVYKEFKEMAHRWATPDPNVGGPGAIDPF
ncbi:MAG: DUF4760 domain-containing protein [Acidimicrobiia bacterium]